MQIEKTRGLIAAPFTPMTTDGQVNLDRIEGQAEFLCRNGVVGAFVCGTTGEGLSLSIAERIQIAQRWIDAAPKEFRVIVHVGHTSLPECKMLAEQAQRAGAFGIAALSPFFFRPKTIETLVEFCREVAAAASATPFYYYHIPAMTGVDFPMADFLRIGTTRIPTLAGMKFTHTDLEDYQRCHFASKGQLDLLFGIDQMLHQALPLGTTGAVGTNYNYLTPLFLQVLRGHYKGDTETVRQCQNTANRIIDLLMKAPCGFHVAAKHTMQMVGFDCGPARLPLRNLNQIEYQELRKSLSSAGLFEVCSK